LKASAKNHSTPGGDAFCQKCGAWRGELGQEPAPCTVLDPFSGAGTTAMVAAQLGRRAIGIDLSEKYNRMAAARIGRALRPATFVPASAAGEADGDEDAAADLPLLAEATIGGSEK